MNKDNQILKSNLSTLLKRFSKTDVISKIDDEYQNNKAINIDTWRIQDNSYLKDISLNEKTLETISRDMLNHGIIVPLLVRPLLEGQYELVVGRRRLECAKKLQFTSISCVIQDFSDENMLLYMLFACQKEKNKPIIEMATICQILCDKFKYTQGTLADILNTSRSQITNLIRILKLPKQIQDDLVAGKLSYGHARALAVLSPEDIMKVVDVIYKNKLSVHDVEYLVSELEAKRGYDEILKSYQKKNHLKAKINGKHLILSFDSQEELLKFLKK